MVEERPRPSQIDAGHKAVPAADVPQNDFPKKQLWLKAKQDGPVIVFAGHNIGEDYLFELTEYLKDKKFGVINISKSGTTTETALAFRLLKKQCEDQLGKEMAKKVIVAVTDAKKGAARVTADKEGYQTFIIPDNVGGRFSVLTPVGLLPIAVAGFDIEKLVEGARTMETICGPATPFAENPAAVYAATRNELYKDGKKIEILVNFNPKLHYMNESLQAFSLLTPEQLNSD